MEDGSLNKEIPSWLGCPLCQDPLVRHNGDLYCPSHEMSFPMVDGILQMLTSDRSAAAGAFAVDYRKRRENQAWRALSAAEIATLPEKIPTNWDRLYWQVRRQSYRKMLDLIETDRQLKEPYRVVDMGAGFGWLAARLAADGHEVVALDLNLDDAFGLGAAQRLRQFSGLDLTLVQGAIENPPFQRQQVDLLVYSASLHYASEIECCLTLGAALLRQGGALIIMDSPVVEKATDPEWFGGRKLEKGRLLAALEGAGLAPRTCKNQAHISLASSPFKNEDVV